jgi:hypothetical protein
MPADQEAPDALPTTEDKNVAAAEVVAIAQTHTEFFEMLAARGLVISKNLVTAGIHNRRFSSAGKHDECTGRRSHKNSCE